MEFATAGRESGEERWLIMVAQQPGIFQQMAGKTFSMLARAGVRLLFYSFDEASRRMVEFADVAPHLRVLIHDECPLGGAAARLPGTCLRVHRSWVANLIPYGVPFPTEPEKKIVFLGSEIGLTDERRRQLAFLQQTFRDRMVVYTDHSLSVRERQTLGRFGVSFCPEGRHFTTPAMSRSHTDRPFWSGCLGMVPVCENSTAGDRLNDLAGEGLIVRYEHGDLKSLKTACERALAYTDAERRRIYDHFNAHETIGTVVADAIARLKG